MHTIKPLDEAAIIRSAEKTGAVVSCEEHQINGGLGDSIAQCLARHLPTPMEMVAVKDQFGESGKPLALLEKYGLSTQHIVDAAITCLKRKQATNA